ncbi:hypothetical protein A3A49_02515 [Candidatus Curtissbacteria bacterium RIFCSPLOWO2_01_FULL_38_11b]|uniref:Peptidoglycan hydrolase PcsB coiled-coil domain-containing protein n=1 Tax=Candidatus Curtissbacteria bacterium RIFCSPLOWO2_01_FULL_38_11b TaxID=1797725 RepID=A0A1F5GYU1_9BACT|nr:MAG: hypothetical protein A3A49_02515 [Candidatus Curtissbacteria bacterium RIFCSPLOWO2_01_FULL_38_11b]
MKIKFVFFLLPLIIILFVTGKTYGVSLDECEKDASANLSECVDLFSQKINDLSTQKRTLSSQIAQFDTQIKVTQLKITDAQNTIEKLEKEIGVLSFRIGYVNQSIDKLEELVKKRIVATYQQSFVSNLELVVASNDFSDLILKLQYLKQVQENDKKILASLQETRSNYANQKDERETKQAAIEENKVKLEQLKAGLDTQKAEKQAFLAVTKNDEARYQRLLAQAEAERAIVFGGGKDVFIRDVSQGETIGIIASYSTSPGCSSGAHLHFEVHKNGSVQDPNNYLQSTSVNYPKDYNFEIYGSVNPRGDLPWPINGPIQINQGFGVQRNSSFYGPAGHQGIDMDSLSSSAVKAVRSGKLYGGSIQCGGKYAGALYYAKIEHDDGLITWYLHTVPQ